MFKIVVIAFALSLAACAGQPYVPTPVGAECPDGYSAEVYVFSRSAIKPELRELADKIIEANKRRDGMNMYTYDPYGSFSTTLGPRLRAEEQVARVSLDIEVWYLDPATGSAVKYVGMIFVHDGRGTFLFPDDPRRWLLKTGWLKVLSPTSSRGEHQLRVQPRERWAECKVTLNGLVD